MLRVLRILLWALVVTGLAGVGTYFYLGQQKGAVQPLVTIGGPFKLAATTGETIDSTGLKGEPFAVFFGFTHCPEVCPTTLYEMSSTLGKLGDEAKNLRVYFVTVDPERDTLDFMKSYLTSFDPRIIGLRPSADELAQIAKAYRVFYERVPTSDGGYTMNHTALVYLMDREGRFFGTLDYEEKPEMRLTKLKRLLKEG
ncbi:SCO family protein [Aestuariivirga sp. YIM B02566]|uniref:SCO family protein n=1 Tax=Taklimakanibacter albus TaxID=2800327 RepID=A0ACC5R3V2_9HYPH|nr:SCO family protein [Aestuariivirga sp. YIM B02566]MBK1867329.1 SCO family protein [Aestuariivirga sp. YIM B02566]